jgi:hypothetical protein
MEAETAKRMWIRAQDSGLHYDVQIGDEDASTRKKLLDEVPEHLRPSIKKSDHNHIRRNLRDHLFQLKRISYSGTGILSTAIIMKLTSDFSVAVKTNRGNTELCKLAIENVIEHNFNCHKNCGSWCLYKEDSILKPHLPFGIISN